MGKIKYKPIKTKYGYYYTDPLPSEADIKTFYEEEFYQKPKPSINDSSLEVRDNDSDFYNFWYEFYLQLLIKESNQQNISKFNLVDLGCGYGHFLKYLKDNSNMNRLLGIEPFPEFLDYVLSQNINGKVSTLEQFANTSTEKFDIVTMVNVLEHLRHPENVIEDISNNLLTENGILLLQVPNDFNMMQKVAVEKNNCKEWWFCPPQHLSYFSPTSLENLLKAYGFNSVKTYCSFPIDMFLLMDIDYINNPKLGRDAHLKRLSFEKSIKDYGNQSNLEKVFRGFALAEIGREIICIAKK